MPGNPITIDQRDEIGRAIPPQCGFGEMRIGRQISVCRTMDIGEIAPAAA